MEVGDHAGSHTEIVRRENELIGPSFEFFQMSVGTYCRFNRTHHGSSDSTDLATVVLTLVHNTHNISVHDHLFGIHLMLCQIFHVDFTEVS